MRPNDTRRRLAEDRPAIGIFVGSASPLIAEIIGSLGFDWVLLDLQHGEGDGGNLGGMLQAISATRATPFVRVPLNDPREIGRALDLGAYGIIVPLVNTPADAAAAVRAAKYPPRGARSWGPVRGAVYGGPGYFAEADEETQLVVMLETAEAVANAREILATPGIAGGYIGPNDLCISYGVPPEGATLPDQIEEAIATVLAAARDAGKFAGIHLYDAEAANRRIRQGFRMIGLGAELRAMRAATAAMLNAVER